MIDVVLPFRGDAAHMLAAVGSIQAQDVTDWRLHVLDDADPDPTVGERIAALDDPRITVSRAPERLGVNGAFRRCATLGTAELLTFMGCDDLMRPDHLRRTLDLARRFPGAAMLHPGVEVFDGEGAPSRPLGDRVKALLRPAGDALLGGEELLVSLLHGNWLYFPAVTWRRDALERHPFRPGLETVLDLQLVVDLLLDDQQLALGDEVTFRYRRHAASASSVTARSAERFDEGARFFDETARRCDERGWHRAARASRWRLTTRAHTLLTAASAVRTGRPGPAARLARLALS